jgi:hypothetical protein
MESEQAKLLAKEWRAVLDTRQLPYFHMVDCAHGSGVFKPLTPQQRIYVASQMIGIIKRRTIAGFAISVNVEQFREMMPEHHLIGSAYSFCATLVIAAIRRWIMTVNYSGDMAYFFEAGHPSKSEADRIMTGMFNDPKLRALSRYVGHAFVEKKRSAPVQAADLLAWQFYTDARRQVEGHTVHRKDFESLLEHPHQVHFVTPSKMARARELLPWVSNDSDTEWPEVLLPWKLNAERLLDEGQPS